MTCDKHTQKPERGYSACAGCEIERLKARVAELEAAVALAAKTFRQYQNIHIRKFLSRQVVQVVQGDTNLTQEDQNNLAKSKRNMDLAEVMERALAGRKE